jgi:hypothetical protein
MRWNNLLSEIIFSNEGGKRERYIHLQQPKQSWENLIYENEEILEKIITIPYTISMKSKTHPTETIEELNKNFEVPPKDTKQAQLILRWAKLVNYLVHYGFPSNDLHKTAKRVQWFFSRKIEGADGQELTSLSPELSAWWEKLRKHWGIITVNHPSKVFLDPTAVISLIPSDLWLKTKVITSSFQFPMNESLFDKEKTGKFIPAVATRDYIEQLRLLEKHVQGGGVVFMIPNGTEEIFQWTFWNIIKKWDKNTPVFDFTLGHSELFQWYGKLLLDYFRIHPIKIKVHASLKTLGNMSIIP